MTRGLRVVFAEFHLSRIALGTGGMAATVVVKVLVLNFGAQDYLKKRHVFAAGDCVLLLHALSLSFGRWII